MDNPKKKIFIKQSFVDAAKKLVFSLRFYVLSMLLFIEKNLFLYLKNAFTICIKRIQSNLRIIGRKFSKKVAATKLDYD